MAKQRLNLGVGSNDNTGDTLRAAGEKINENFDELYNIVVTGDSDGFDSDYVRVLATTNAPWVPPELFQSTRMS